MYARLFGIVLAVGVSVGAIWLTLRPESDRVGNGLQPFPAEVSWPANPPQNGEGLRPADPPQVAEGLQPGARDLRGGDHFAILKRGPACVQKDLTTGRFRAGSDFNALCNAWKPDVIVKHGRYVTAVYGRMGPEMVSYDHTYVSSEGGKLFYAFGGGCVWGCVFFSTLTEPGERKWNDSFYPAAEAWRVEQRANYFRRLAALGVAGPAAIPLHPESWELH